jgi:acetylornithine deacetylase/succinyl-diaminopimelate desuccinylase-like protein
VNDPAVRIEKIMGFTPAVSSTDTDLYRAITDVCMKHYPEAGITPSVSTGFTDSHFFRDLGIASYGFNAMIIPAAIAGGVHGNNERVPVDSVKQGVRMLLEIIERVVH